MYSYLSCFVLTTLSLPFFFFFFFNDTATTEIYTLSLHDALPISRRCRGAEYHRAEHRQMAAERRGRCDLLDRKSTRLNSSHVRISYAVFCLKKKKKVRGGLNNDLHCMT